VPGKEAKYAKEKVGGKGKKGEVRRRSWKAAR
jgi:hypothetical protein